MIKAITVTALHGFLGCASDWSQFSNIHTIDIQMDAKSDTLWKWAQTFNEAHPRQHSTTHVLMGYSLGGRLALHALLSPMSPWDAAIIISAHPGLASHKDKQARLKKDLVWAERFEKESWNDLMAAWESQEVFAKSTHRFNRKEIDCDRSQLAEMLRRWSLGCQENLLPRLQSLSLPILWIAGENDLAYRDRALSLQLAHPLSRIWIAPNAGHRVPWEQPSLFQDELRIFNTKAQRHKDTET